MPRAPARLFRARARRDAGSCRQQLRRFRDEPRGGRRARRATLIAAGLSPPDEENGVRPRAGGAFGARGRRRFAAALPGWARVEAVNDAVAACIGANGVGDGGLVIAGTGSAGIARVGGKATIVGGRGFLIGDDGAGARIGADALRAALRASTVLSRRATSHASRQFGGDALAMIEWAPQRQAQRLRGVRATRVRGRACRRIWRTRDRCRAGRAIVAFIAKIRALGVEGRHVGGVAEPLRNTFRRPISDEASQAPQRRRRRRDPHGRRDACGRGLGGP